MYSKVTPGIIEQLRTIVGFDKVLIEEERLEPYSHDKVTGLKADPEVVVKVSGAEQISQVFRLAQRERIPVTPRGAGY